MRKEILAVILQHELEGSLHQFSFRLLICPHREQLLDLDNGPASHPPTLPFHLFWPSYPQFNINQSNFDFSNEDDTC